MPDRKKSTTQAIDTQYVPANITVDTESIQGDAYRQTQSYRNLRNVSLNDAITVHLR